MMDYSCFFSVANIQIISEIAKKNYSPSTSSSSRILTSYGCSVSRWKRKFLSAHALVNYPETKDFGASAFTGDSHPRVVLRHLQQCDRQSLPIGF